VILVFTAAGNLRGLARIAHFEAPTASSYCYSWLVLLLMSSGSESTKIARV
jgi:hypothetical protein